MSSLRLWILLEDFIGLHVSENGTETQRDFSFKKRESRKEKERQAGRKEGKSDRVTLCLKCSLALRTKFKAVLTSFTQKGAGVGSEDGGAGPPASWVLAPHLSAPRGPGPAHHSLGSRCCGKSTCFRSRGPQAAPGPPSESTRSV